ncbi:MAG: metallophosphoesterase family protein [Devosia sp.]|nr:metallophosphoesterase family protein [Devosia sp.]
MRLLIVSDVHANGGALDAIRETADAVVVLGDIVDYGPDPHAAIDWARHHATFAVRGNHDHAVLTGERTGAGPAWADLAEESAAWTRSVLESADLAYLKSLPTSLTFSFGGARFAAFHAAPSDPLYRYLPPETAEADWRAEVERVDADWLLLGHTHRPLLRKVGPTVVLNPGSVGQPRAGAPFATCAIWEDGDVFLVQRRYAVETVVDRLAATSLAEGAHARLARILRTGEIPLGPPSTGTGPHG